MAHPFDAVATGYDEAFTERKLGRYLRDLVRELVREWAPDWFGPGPGGARVLELGCGTGEDALWLAEQGIRVTATDASEGMLAVAHRKASARAHGQRVSFAPLDLRRPDELATLVEREGPFDGLFSNFGALNCVAETGTLVVPLARALRPGARAVLVVMGPLCLGEVAAGLLRLDLRAALRRFGGHDEARIGDTRLPVWYPGPRRLARDFAPVFRHLRTAAIGTLMPPSDQGLPVERRPRLFELLARLDRGLVRAPLAARLSDHYLIVLERREGSSREPAC